jgi:hypothetical protein
MYLVASGSRGGQVAVDLSVVQRVEHIPAAAVRRSGEVESIAYDDGTLPLVRMANAHSSGPPPDVLPTVVCRSSVGLIGVVVGRIDDIAPQVDGSPMELLDVEALLADAGLA